MISPEELAKLNRTWWTQGYCCAPATFGMAVSPLGRPGPQTLRALTAFCGGMGPGATCGVLSGCLAALGCWLGKGGGLESRDDRLKALSAALYEEFEDHFGSLNCRDLAPAEHARRREVCPTFSLWAVERLWTLLQEGGIDLSCRPDGRE